MALKSLSPGLYKSARGQIVATLLNGTLAGRSFVLGDTDFTRNISTEKSERYTNEFAVKTLAYSEIDQLTAELTVTAYQAGQIAQMVAHMSEARTVDQAALIGQTVELIEARGDEIIEIDARRIGNVVVSAGITPLTEGVDYVISTGDSKSFISLLGTVAVTNVDINVDYDRLASKGTRYDFGSVSEILVRLVYVENVKPAAGRSPETHVYHRVGLTVDGDYTLIGSDSGPRTVTIKGKIYPDSTKPEGQMLGYVETDIQAAA